jgi:putative ABC transport system permease protein
MSNRNTGRSFMRQSLVVVQFSLCICVLIAMIVVHQQLRYMEKADIGFNKNNLINIGFISWDGKAEVFKNELNSIPGVLISSRCVWTPSKGPGSMSSEIENPLRPGNKITLWYLSGDLDFAQTLELKLREGRYLNSSFKGDVAPENNSVLITATTAKMLGIKKLNVPLKMIGITPVGIVADFHNESLHEALGPTVVMADTASGYGAMVVRVKPGTASQVQAGIRSLWARLFPEKLLELDMVSDMLNSQYEKEQKLRQLFSFFGVLTMLLASLGIFGLIVHNIQERIREIAIRKVLGGSVASIAWLLSSRFSKLVGVAIVVASPLGIWSMTKWLQTFAFRISLDWTAPVIAGVTALSIALLTVSWQAIKAALANPVENLRSE